MSDVIATHEVTSLRFIEVIAKFKKHKRNTTISALGVEDHFRILNLK